MVDFFLKRKIKALRRQHKRSKRFMNYADLKRVSILFDIADHEHVVPLVDELLADGKDVMAWTYAARGVQNSDYPPYYNIISDRDLTFCFFPKEYLMNRFLGYPADLLIDLCYTSHALNEFFVASSPALYRLGLKTADPVWYDMIVDIRGQEKEEMEKNAADVLFYLKNLRVK
ncbi:MAG: hypothetical protein PHE04_07130 [Bacteroidales bacterium]|nr:hypothetical protein [Bacteroidales bacterium]